MSAVQAPGNEALYAHPLALFLAQRPGTADEAAHIMHRDLTRRQSVEAYAVLAWVEPQRGDVIAALDASEKARAWGSPTPTMDYVHGRVLDAIKRPDEAIEMFASALGNMLFLEPHARRRVKSSGV